MRVVTVRGECPVNGASCQPAFQASDGQKRVRLISWSQLPVSSREVFSGKREMLSLVKSVLVSALLRGVFGLLRKVASN